MRKRISVSITHSLKARREWRSLTLRRSSSVIGYMQKCYELTGIFSNARLWTFVALLLLGTIPPSLAAAQTTVESEENKIAQPEKEDPVLDSKPDPMPVTPPQGQFPALLGLYSPGNFFSDYAMVADKKTRTLSVWKLTDNGPELVEFHTIDLGKQAGDKLVLGDQKTPEGIYFFERIWESNRLDYNEYGSRAFVMNYPNYFDQKDKKTGSGIWLHAVPDSKSLLRGSRGCVVVRDKIIKTIGKYIKLHSTPIIVSNNVEYIAQSDFAPHSSKWKNWISSWRQAWESKSIPDYMRYYHTDFSSLSMNKAKWETFKKGLNAKYSYIKLNLYDQTVYSQGDQAIVRFLQSYESDGKSDFGEKVLYLKKEDGEFRILGETWRALSDDLLAQTQQRQKKSTN